ncbi:MAG TPA: AtpZ/AtpI family protein [Actinomycetota bacterium]|nr:AtpZ/AtpI family protein [Actinomycetota bacterium]
MSESPERRQGPSSRKGGWGGDMARGSSQASEGLALAFGFVAAVLGCWFAGRVLDGWLDTEPWFQVVGSIVGWVLGVFVVLQTARHRRQ